MPVFLKLDQARDLLTVSIGKMDKAGFQDTLARVKSIPGGRWEPTTKLWLFQNDPDKALRLITTLQPVASPEVESIVRSHAAEVASQLVTNLPTDAKLSKFKRADDLFPYQRAGVEFIADHGKVILADQMGTGKTVQSVAAHVETHGRYPPGPALVIAPKAMRGRWQREFENWWDGCTTQIIDGKDPAARLKQLKAKADVFIINWESFWRAPVIDALAAKTWSTIIADEAHKAKNYKSKQSKGLTKLSAPLQIAATGTPVMNAPHELFPLLRWHDPKTYGNYWRFYNQYVDDYVGGFNNRIIVGVKNPDDLRFILKDYLIRRRKVDVLKDLPPKLPTQVIEVDLTSSQRKLYEEVETALFIDLARFIVEQTKGLDEADVEKLAEEMANMPLTNLTTMVPHAAARVAKLRQITAAAKIDVANELIREEPDEPVAAFTWHVQAAKDLAAALEHGPQGQKVGVIAGDVDADPIATGFQNGQYDHVVCTIAKGGTGIDLFRSSQPLLIEEDWTPEITEQAIDRTHRIGQTEPVTPRLLRCTDTVDDGRVASRNTFKRAITAQIIGG